MGWAPWAGPRAGDARSGRAESADPRAPTQVARVPRGSEGPSQEVPACADLGAEHRPERSGKGAGVFGPHGEPSFDRRPQSGTCRSQAKAPVPPWPLALGPPFPHLGPKSPAAQRQMSEGTCSSQARDRDLLKVTGLPGSLLRPVPTPASSGPLGRGVLSLCLTPHLFPA